MLLPGISGSTLLLILGIYVPAISAVKEILHFHMQYLPGVLAPAEGVVIGVVFAAKFIRKALQRFSDSAPQMIYLILGLMLGSLYAILMGPTTLNSPQAPVSFETFHGVINNRVSVLHMVAADTRLFSYDSSSTRIKLLT